MPMQCHISPRCGRCEQNDGIQYGNDTHRPYSTHVDKLLESQYDDGTFRSHWEKARTMCEEEYGKATYRPHGLFVDTTRGVEAQFTRVTPTRDPQSALPG